MIERGERGGKGSSGTAVATGGRNVEVDHADEANTIVGSVCDVDVAGSVDGDSERLVDFGTRGSAAVAGESGGAVSGDGRDVTSGGRDFSDAVVHGVGDVEIVRHVENESGGKVKFGAGGGAAVAGESGGAISRNRSDVAGWNHDSCNRHGGGSRVHGADAVV